MFHKSSDSTWKAIKDPNCPIILFAILSPQLMEAKGCFMIEVEQQIRRMRASRARHCSFNKTRITWCCRVKLLSRMFGVFFWFFSSFFGTRWVKSALLWDIWRFYENTSRLALQRETCKSRPSWLLFLESANCGEQSQDFHEASWFAFKGTQKKKGGGWIKQQKLSRSPAVRLGIDDKPA